MLDATQAEYGGDSSRERARMRSQRQAEKSKRLKEALLSGFKEPDECRAHKLLCDVFHVPDGKRLQHHVILPIAELISIVRQEPLYREAQKWRDLTLKWLEEHYDALEEELPRMTFHFDEGEVISGAGFSIE